MVCGEPGNHYSLSLFAGIDADNTTILGRWAGFHLGISPWGEAHRSRGHRLQRGGGCGTTPMQSAKPKMLTTLNLYLGGKLG